MFLDYTYISIYLPWPLDFLIWEGMVNTAWLKLLNFTCLWCGFTGAVIAMQAWSGYRLSTQGRKNEN